MVEIRVEVLSVGKLDKKILLHVVVGLGSTGMACVHYLLDQGLPVAVNDNRSEPPGVADLKETYPHVEVAVGEFSSALMARADVLVVSPGVALAEPAIAECMARGVPAIGDIELFVRQAKAPIIAITGSNGKTTVTTLLAQMLEAAGFKIEIGGNIGRLVLPLLKLPVPDFYVLELSSFQLETTSSLHAQAAVLLNLMPDHMDRYVTLNDYLRAKQRVYKNCSHAVINADQPDSWQGIELSKQVLSFGLQAPQGKQLGVAYYQGQRYLAYGDKRLLPVAEMTIKTQFFVQNALAALALGIAVGGEIAPVVA